ncbi:DUF2309 domain-containing protein [Fibrella sp. USSR17]
MKPQKNTFDAEVVLHDLKHYLPAQAPLKDFIHHNTLHAFQTLPFYQGIQSASQIFGYKVSLSLEEYRALYADNRIDPSVLNQAIARRKGSEAVESWTQKLLNGTYAPTELPRIGSLRAFWKKQYHVDLDSMVHPLLFRILCSYLDQGISIWAFPVGAPSFLAALRDLERTSYTSFFRTKRARALLLSETTSLTDLLGIVVGNEACYKQYMFDQQFAHQGWSGMVSSVEDQPQALLDQKPISLHDLVMFELMLEIDALDDQFGTDWLPICIKASNKPGDLLRPVAETELDEALSLWQDAFEWTYYDQVLAGISQEPQLPETIPAKSFQAMFCIDDRECSLRRHLEHLDPSSETFGTPGFFGVETYFQPEGGKYYDKVCPAPLSPKFLIKERGKPHKHERDVHFSKHAHSFHSGWLISQTLGFWSAMKLLLNIFRPTMSPATATSFRHMDKSATLTVEHMPDDKAENGLEIGFRVDEMAQRVEGLLKSIGMVTDFAPIVYIVGHGSSSVNNPHYAAYDCGACSGRAGSVNSRAMSYMANHAQVRSLLRERGIAIPDGTQFIGALHDTTRDEIAFFDEDTLSPVNQENHRNNQAIFAEALDLNAKERSRRFMSIDTKGTPKAIHKLIKLRSVSLFEPRPELNHATNALCIVGRRSLSKHLFLDRRSFLNSYDYRVDPDGEYLMRILNAAAPVCGGINLEYFFSRVDNQKLGAGTKLPHNVMGLFGVANGIDGDLRPGLPSQMIEVHDPIRLLMIVEHYPDVALKTIQRNPATYEWFINEWVHLVVVDPDTHTFWQFKNGSFSLYEPIMKQVQEVTDVTPMLEAEHENIRVLVLN